MTDFMVFLETGLTVLRESNYDVFLALSQLSLSNLRYNIGFYFLGGYLGLYLILWLILALVNRRRKKANFYYQLFMQTKEEAKILKEREDNKIVHRVSRIENMLSVLFRVYPVSTPSLR